MRGWLPVPKTFLVRYSVDRAGQSFRSENENEHKEMGTRLNPCTAIVPINCWPIGERMLSSTTWFRWVTNAFTMSIPPAISFNTKKEVSSPLLACETSKNAQESCRHQTEQRSGEEARDREENSVETLFAQIPSPPSFLPDDMEDGKKRTTPVPSKSSVHHAAASAASSLWRDSKSDLPISRGSDDEVKLLWPLEVCLVTR